MSALAPRAGVPRPLIGLAALVVLSATFTPACQEEKAAPPPDMARIAADNQAMKDAEAAANTVIRNATDCEAARAALPDAQAKLDEAERRVQTAAGRTTLDALKTQVRRVAELCPG
jgi:hypothetical protein